MSSLEKARQEVEQELEATSARIQTAVTRLKGDVSLPGSSLGRFARNHPYESLFGLVAVGAAAVFLLSNRSGQSSDRSQRKTTGVSDAYADVIAARMREAEKSGIDSERALHAAIRANPPVVLPASPSRSVTPVQKVADKFVSTVTAMFFDYATNWLREFINRRDTTA